MADGLSAGTTSLIACSSPLVVAAIGAVSGWEGLRPAQWFGIGLGVLGVLVTLADRVGRPPNATSLLWALLGLAGLAVGTSFQARLDTEAGPSAVAAIEVAAGFAVLAVWAPLEGEVGLPLTPSGLATFAWLAVVTGVGAPLLLFALVRRRGATDASSYLFVVPAVTALAAWPMLGLPLGPLTVVGLVIVVLALSLATGRIGGPGGLSSPASSRRTPHRTPPRTPAGRPAPAAPGVCGELAPHRGAARTPCLASGSGSPAAPGAAR
jgi:drug/metabolite transporter (DMT)-like permease